MLNKSVEQALGITVNCILQAKGQSDMVAYFVTNREKFLLSMDFDKIEEKKLIFIAYDKLVIDFLVSKGVNFKPEDVSIEFLTLGSLVGSTIFINIVKESLQRKNFPLIETCLLLATFVFNSKNTDISEDEMKALRKNMLSMTSNPMPPVYQHRFYRVTTFLTLQTKMLIAVVAIALGSVLFRVFRVGFW